MDFQKRQATLRQIIRYCDSASVMVITPGSKLRRIYTPFNVEVVTPVKDFLPGQVLQVTSVKTDHYLKLIYIIGGYPFTYNYFLVLG